jgi:hypothetical protein
MREAAMAAFAKSWRREWLNDQKSAAPINPRVDRAWPVAARAQQAERMRRVGVLTNLAADDPEGQVRNIAFAQALARGAFVINLKLD